MAILLHSLHISFNNRNNSNEKKKKNTVVLGLQYARCSGAIITLNFTIPT